VVVFATQSLKAPFEALAKRYEQDHSGAKVELRFDGGNQLLDAMNAGEKCDVIVIGDSSLMSKFAAAAHLAAHSPAELARNRVAIVVAKGNPKQVKGLADFGRADLKVALGARSASIGRHARWVLSKLQLDPKPACQANTADGVLTKVAAGEADVGIVYATSFAGTPAVERIDVPEADNTPVLYSISATREAKEPNGAAAFRALALGPVGQQILHEAGLLPIGAK
jgi:molybdate transport system substrate-binding protein